MTLAATSIKIQYSGDGSTTEFAIPFKFIANANIKAILRDSNDVETTWTEGSDYTLAGAGDASGGTLTAITIPATGETLTIKSAATEAQNTALPLGGEFPSTSVEDALDFLTRLVQQHSEELTRSFKLSEGTTLPPSDFPEPESEKLIGWNTAATKLENKLIKDLDLTLDTLISGLADNHFLVHDGTRFVNEAPADARTSMGVAIGLDVQAWDAQLDDIAALAVTADNFIVSDGSNWVAKPSATQAGQEAGTATNVVVTPGRQHFHQSAAKFWCKFDGTAAGPITPSVDYNVVDVTDNGTGNYTVNIDTDFSGANWCAFVAGTGGGETRTGTQAAGTLQVRTFDTAISAVDLAAIFAGGFGDQ